MLSRLVTVALVAFSTACASNVPKEPPPDDAVTIEVLAKPGVCPSPDFDIPTVCLRIRNIDATAVRFNAWCKDGLVELYPHAVTVEAEVAPGEWASTDVTSLSEYFGPTCRVVLANGETHDVIARPDWTFPQAGRWRVVVEDADFYNRYPSVPVVEAAAD